MSDPHASEKPKKFSTQSVKGQGIREEKGEAQCREAIHNFIGPIGIAHEMVVQQDDGFGPKGLFEPRGVLHNPRDTVVAHVASVGSMRSAEDAFEGASTRRHHGYSQTASVFRIVIVHGRIDGIALEIHHGVIQEGNLV